MSKHFKLSQKEGLVSDKFGSLDNDEEWVSSFMPQLRSMDGVRKINKNFKSNITHAGLIYYFHYCWAKEKGSVLRPDMVWFTIVSEIAHTILRNSKHFKHLFTDTEEKQKIITITDNATDIDIDKLTEALKASIKNKILTNILTETRFDSEVDNAYTAIQMTLACMSTPFFSYMTTMCGIKSVNLYGSFDEWYKILINIETLKTQVFYDKDNYIINMMCLYLEDVRNVIGNIIYHGKFDNIDLVCARKARDSDDMDFSILEDNKVKYRINNVHVLHASNSDDFWNDIFRYDKNTLCGSGHPREIVYGWIKDLYTKNDSLYQFNKHVNYVPYKNIETGGMFCKVVGLSHSIIENNILHPQYGIIKYEIEDEKVFNKLAKK